MTHTRTTNRPPANGFSLIELLVVIFIIAVIAGLLLGGVAFVQQGAKESQAQTILTNLMGNAGTYEVKTGSPVPHENAGGFSTISWGGPRAKNALAVQGQSGTIQALHVNDNYDSSNDNVTYSDGKDNDYYMERANLFIERFIWAANQMPDIRNNLPALGGAFVDADDDGFMEVIDPWGNPVAYAQKVTHKTSSDTDFLPAHDAPFFASAGKDQKWGLPKNRGEFNSDAAWEAYMATDDYKFAQDNLYSFDLDRSQSHR